MSFVTVHHPSGSQAVVAESAVPDLIKAGWKKGPRPATKKEQQAEKAETPKEK